jgi:hypothetical protein
MQEIFLMEGLRDEYNQEIYAWYDFEADCDDWYMDSCHFWDDNHFHILFDDSTPPSVENINVPHQVCRKGCISEFLSEKHPI